MGLCLHWEGLPTSVALSAPSAGTAVSLPSYSFEEFKGVLQKHGAKFFLAAIRVKSRNLKQMRRIGVSSASKESFVNSLSIILVKILPILLNLQFSCFLCIDTRTKQLQTLETHISEAGEAEILALL